MGRDSPRRPAETAKTVGAGSEASAGTSRKGPPRDWVCSCNKHNHGNRCAAPSPALPPMARRDAVARPRPPQPRASEVPRHLGNIPTLISP